MKKIRKLLIYAVCLALCFTQGIIPVFAQDTKVQDLYENAQIVTLGDELKGTLAAEEQRNTYKIEIPKNAYYSLTGLTTTRDLRIGVYDVDGEDEGSGGYRFSWRIKQKVETRDYTLYLKKGTHYIQFWTYGEQPQGQYTFKIKELKLPDVKKLYLRKTVSTAKNLDPWFGIRIDLEKQDDPKIGYIVWIADNAKFKNAQKYITSGSFSDGLEGGKTYYVKARTFVQIKDENLIYGKLSKVQKIKL